ncbi:Uma2 family endonuclease [Niabella pedocola]|uniref:Uma2 family endonuclease n=1 Tax=Niabella pedocola TaxID=1752077 RepID=A0ABS8PTP8_9BACT|nr:Uma2 family endonuclease [Niabella pedocola]MCD2423653.1 Uma2 family endonuclease [Niabella pedocola]
MDSENNVEEPFVPYGAITSLDQLDLSERYSYADYFRWKFRERVELLRGWIHKMSPAPGIKHQSASLKLTLKIGNYFEGKSCNVFAAPFDVRLPDSKKQTNDAAVFTVVQPDICVICDAEKIDDRGCIGAPDLVVEILSPGNTQKEMGIKFDLYEESGVKEYWLVEPQDKVILVYILKDGKFQGIKPFIETDEIRSALFPELKFNVRDIFE